MLASRIPSEVSFDWVYFAPFFFTVLAGFVCAYGIMKLLVLTGCVRFFWHSGLVFVSLWLLMTSLVGLTIIPP